jgi:hypothetical protein
MDISPRRQSKAEGQLRKQDERCELDFSGLIRRKRGLGRCKYGSIACVRWRIGEARLAL